MSLHHVASCGRRILVVDDLQANRAVTSAVLESAGYIVECAHDGMQALAMLEREMFDLVLLDIEMPGLDGYETASAMHCAEHGAIRLAALTVDASSARRRRSEKVGLQAHIAKPITSKALLEEVARLCDRALETRFDPWRREDYKELVGRLGLDRVYGYLQQFYQRLRDFLTIEVQSKRDVHRAAHDLASVSGMMGFSALSGCCVEFMAARGAVNEQSLLIALMEAGSQAETRLNDYFARISTAIA